MNCNTYKEDAMQYVRSVAAGKAERLRKTMEMKKEVKSTMRNFHTKQMGLKHDLMTEMNDLCDAMSQAEAERIAKFELFKKQLEKEGNHRHKDRIKLAQNVSQKLSGFDQLQQQMRQDLDRDYQELQAMMKDQEHKRMAEFGAFEHMIAMERKELNDMTNRRAIATQRFLNQCKKTQSKMANDMQAQFSETKKIRAEIQKTWAAISMGALSPILTAKDAHMTGNGSEHAAEAAHMAETAKMHHEHAEKFEAEGEPDGESSGALDNLAMKVKAVISGFHEGCKASELHRALGDVSKNSVREAIDELLSAKEIRRDDNHRFHLI